MAKAVFLGYRGGLRNKLNKQILIKIDQIDDKDKAAAYIGKKATWKTQRGNLIVGTIVGVLGGNGVLKVRMRNGLPGQAIGKELNIT